MSIPDYQSIMLPLLQLASDKQEHSLRKTIEVLSSRFALTEAERAELLPSGRQTIFDNRVGWACTYLKKAGLLTSIRRAFYQITERGLDVLAASPIKIDLSILKKYPEFVEFQTLKKETQNQLEAIPQQDEQEQGTPEELLDYSYQKMRHDLAMDLLQRVKNCSPRFFETLVVDLLVTMGYGGSFKDAGQAIGKSGDGGIDGIIKEDRLGLDTIYIQAKRWDGTVGRPEIQKFAGALQGQRARKGIFITTSAFSKEALEYVKIIDSKIVLLDGEQLAQFMIDYNIGVSRSAVYEIKRLDSDYFADE